MSAQRPTALTPTGTIASRTDRRRVVFATVVGTTVEWYDFFIYAQAAALIFADLFFKPMGSAGQIVSYVTVGISFVFRPLGAGEKRCSICDVAGVLGACFWLTRSVPARSHRRYRQPNDR